MKLRDHYAFLNATADKALYDALFMSLDKLRSSQRRRNVVLVLTTGGTMKNEHSAAQVRNLARQLDAQIFGVDFPPDLNVSGDIDGKQSAADAVGPLGGQNFVATSAVGYLNVCRKIAIGLRNQYELSYRSTSGAHDGKYRRVQVKLHLPKGAPELFVQARDGYYADVA